MKLSFQINKNSISYDIPLYKTSLSDINNLSSQCDSQIQRVMEKLREYGPAQQPWVLFANSGYLYMKGSITFKKTPPYDAMYLAAPI